MDSKIHPAVAFLVIALAIAAAGIWMWGSGEAKQRGGPASMLIDPSGRLYVQMQNQLLEHDENGVFVTRHNLSELGVDQVIGGMAFFANGDILLRRGADSRSLLDNIRAFLRQTNRRSLDPEDQGAGLYRCSLLRDACEVFGSKAIDFKAAYSVYIEPVSSTVFVSDTTRHKVRMYGAEGEPIGEPVGGFRFPNKLLMHDGRLFIADTNHHQVRILSPGISGLGSLVVSEDVIPGIARRHKQTWPSYVARVGEHWWTVNMTQAMNYGGIYIFGNDWSFQRRVSLPDAADPIAIVEFDGEVLVSDWYNDRVHRVSLAGEYHGEFVSPGLRQLVEESEEQRLRYQIYSYFGIVALVAVLLLLIVRALTTTSDRRRP